MGNLVKAVRKAHQFTGSLCSCEVSAGNMPLCFILVLVWYFENCLFCIL